MKGNTLTFHDRKSFAAISEKIGQAAFSAAFFILLGITWVLLLPFEASLKLTDFLTDFFRKHHL